MSNIQALIAASFVGVISGAMGSWLLVAGHRADIEARLALSPPIAIVDFPAIAMQLTGDKPGLPPEKLEAVLRNTDEAVGKLRQAGFLVLTADAVVNASPDLYLPADTIISSLQESENGAD